MYQSDSLFSTNLASVEAVIRTMDIENDPYVISLRHQLSKTTQGTAQHRQLDQKLSKVILKQNSFTHKGLNDFARAANEILFELGVWATDWYIFEVLKKAKEAASPNNGLMPMWQNKEKRYLFENIMKMVVLQPSFDPDDIIDDMSDKARVLINTLLLEKEETEANNESYSGLVFVTRRDVVIALTELLSHHPQTKNLFRVGLLLGTSESSHRHSFLDITTKLRKENQEITLTDFKIGEKNLIVSTSVAEEGIDVQACGSVIRFDPPPNIVSWAQSRGRARKQRSSFTLMFEKGSAHQKDVEKWEDLEKEMIQRYTDPARDLQDNEEELDFEDEILEYRVESTK